MKLYGEDSSVPECSAVLAHKCSSGLRTSANDVAEQNAVSAWDFCTKGCLLSLLCLIVKMYMGDTSWVTCFIMTTFPGWVDHNSGRPLLG